MAFTIHDYHDLMKLLREHPEWQKELRQLLLPDELLALPEMVQQLVRAQQNAEERLSRLEAAVERLTEQVSALTEGQKRLAEGQKQLIKRVDSLGKGQERIIERVDTLEEGQKRIDEGQKRLIKRVDSLGKGQERIIERVDTLEEGQKRIDEGQKQLIKRVDSLKEGQKELKKGQKELRDDIGELKGKGFERDYKDKVSAYFGRRLRRAKPTELYTLEDRLDEVLTLDELDDFFRLDLLVTGKLRHVPESPEVLLAMEISSVVDKNDVSRAVHRANLLRKASIQAVPVVAGEDVTRGANEAVREQSVLLVQNGRVEFWKEAVANWVDIQLPDD